MDDCLACRVELHPPDDEHMVARNMQRKEINILRKLCTKLALFTRLYKDVRSTKHEIQSRFCEILCFVGVVARVSNLLRYCTLLTGK